MAGRKPDPFTSEGAALIAAELEQYAKQGTSREQRRHYLAQWVQLLNQKQCNISEIVRALRTVGVKTTRQTVSGIIRASQAGPPAASPAPPHPPVPPPVEPGAVQVRVEPSGSGKSHQRPPHSGLRNVKL